MMVGSVASVVLVVLVPDLVVVNFLVVVFLRAEFLVAELPFPLYWPHTPFKQLSLQSPFEVQQNPVDPAPFFLPWAPFLQLVGRRRNVKFCRRIGHEGCWIITYGGEEWLLTSISNRTKITSKWTISWRKLCNIRCSSK